MLFSAAAAKPIEDGEIVKSNCCGNGCRDCVLADANDSANQDYFDKIEAQMAALASSETRKDDIKSCV
jgi:hypothetical protein